MLIYEDFRARQRGDGAAACCASSASTTALRSQPVEANRDGAACARRACSEARALGRISGARRARGPSRARSRRSRPRRLRRGALGGRRAARSLSASRRRPTTRSMRELRAALQGRGRVALERVPRSRPRLASGAMTAIGLRSLPQSHATRPRTSPGLLHRRAPQERHHRAVRDAAQPPADLHARAQGDAVLRARAAPAADSGARPPARHARPVPARCSRCARRASAWARPRPPTCARAWRRRRIAELAAGRADHRDPARARELPALDASGAAARTTSRPRRTCATRSSASEREPATQQAGSAGTRLETACEYAAQLRRYHEAFPARAGAGADLRRLPRRQRGHRAARC